MSTHGRVLIVDDDPDFVAVYHDTLVDLGLLVDVAHDASAAVAQLETAGDDLDVVLLDQRLQGPGGPDSGLDLVGEIARLAPFAKTIVVTGYASPDAIERAFAIGVYDYLVKNGAFDALLRAKIRNAVEVTSERRVSVLSRARLGTQLRETWAQALVETDRSRKGVLLEEVVKLLFRATPGFERVQTRLDNSVEEIDIVVENGSDEAPWKQDGASYILGECKHWSKPCGAGELGSFYMKLTGKHGRARTGFFFAPGGFTKKFHERLAQRATDDVLIIPVDGSALERWVAADDRLEILAELHRRAVFGS